MPKITFNVPGIPRGKGRPRAARRGEFAQLYTDAKTVSYENRILVFFKQAAPMHKPIPRSYPVRVMVFAYFPIPKSFSRGRRQSCYEHTSKPDADNITKCLDALNAVAWEDDAQIWSSHIEKLYTPAPPKLEIIIEWGESGVIATHTPGLGTSAAKTRKTAQGDLDAQYRVNNSFSAQPSKSSKT